MLFTSILTIIKIDFLLKVFIFIDKHNIIESITNSKNKVNKTES